MLPTFRQRMSPQGTTRMIRREFSWDNNGKIEICGRESRVFLRFNLTLSGFEAFLPFLNGDLSLVHGEMLLVRGVLPLVHGDLPLVQGDLPLVNSSHYISQ